MSFPLDYHTHTQFSCDSQATMDEMCRAAIASGVAEIGFAEHYDNAPRDPSCGFFRLDAWAAGLAACRGRQDGQITLLAGIEIGEPHVYPAEVSSLLGQYPFDYVIGSLHWLGPLAAFEPEFFQRPADEAFRDYFEEMEKMTRQGDFDILGHMEFVTRVGYSIYGEYDPARYEEPIRAVLHNCVARGIALELNTWSVRRGSRRITPALEILRWYRELGGERVTLGSDAHDAESVAQDFDTALATLREAGLRHVTRFRQRQAAFIPLP